jgi:outer membrane lipoprotein carrier protein
LSSFAFGEDRPGKTAPDSTARHAMTRAVEYYRKAQSLSITFNADSYWSATEEWNAYKGSLWLSGKDKFHLFLPEVEMISDGRTLWKYSRENKQVVVENFEESGENVHPSQILFDFLKCKPRGMKEVVEKKKKYLQIDLDVPGNSKSYDSLQVFLETESFAPYKIKTVDAADNKAVYTITSIKRNVKFKEKSFQFTVPRGVEEVDLRE